MDNGRELSLEDMHNTIIKAMKNADTETAEN